MDVQVQTLGLLVLDAVVAFSVNRQLESAFVIQALQGLRAHLSVKWTNLERHVVAMVFVPPLDACASKGTLGLHVTFHFASFRAFTAAVKFRIFAHAKLDIAGATVIFLYNVLIQSTCAGCISLEMDSAIHRAGRPRVGTQIVSIMVVRDIVLARHRCCMPTPAILLVKFLHVCHRLA